MSSELHIRDITSADKGALTRLHDGLSDETRFRRYHAAKGDLTAGDLRYLTEIDGHRHVAVVAEHSARPGELLGVARAVADPDAPEADLAIVVRDDVQDAGVGADLVAALRRRARQEGMGSLVAEVQADNHRALRFFQGHGGRLRRTGGWAGVQALVLPPR